MQTSVRCRKTDRRVCVCVCVCPCLLLYVCCALPSVLYNVVRQPLSHYGHYAVATVTRRSLRGHYGHDAVTLRSYMTQKAVSVTSQVTMQALRGHKINDPKRSGRGHFGHDAVTSRNSYFAVTTRLLRGHNTVTTVTTRSLRLLRSLRSLRSESTCSRLRKRSTWLRKDSKKLLPRTSNFINASNLIHYTANLFQI